MAEPAKQIAAEVLEAFMARGNEARRRAAESLCSLSGARLVCRECGVIEMLTVESSLRYISTGWPNHCGKEMEVRTGV